MHPASERFDSDAVVALRSVSCKVLVLRAVRDTPMMMRGCTTFLSPALPDILGCWKRHLVHRLSCSGLDEKIAIDSQPPQLGTWQMRRVPSAALQNPSSQPYCPLSTENLDVTAVLTEPIEEYCS